MLRFLFCVALMVLGGSHAFAPSPAFSTGARVASSLMPAATGSDASGSSTAGGDAKEVIGRRLTVTGGVQGGYYRSCVRNEVSVLTWCRSVYALYTLRYGVWCIQSGKYSVTDEVLFKIV
jgi:hypothetical protein